MTKISPEGQRLRRTLERLFAGQPDDLRLRDHLEGAKSDPAMGELTPFWGPALYRRNRVLFRPLVFSLFATWTVEAGFGFGVRRVRHLKWADNAEALEGWLGDARAARDTAMVRRLLAWKFADAKGFGVDAPRWRAALLKDFLAADGAAARRLALEDYEQSAPLDESAALSLYEIDRNTRDFIQRHLPFSFDTRKQPRAMWRRLGEAAKSRGDEDFYFCLYRRLSAVDAWSADILALARSTADATALVGELERRHLTGHGLPLGGAVLELLKLRGRDVMPYVRGQLTSLVAGKRFGDGEMAGTYADLAARSGWWDLWAAAIRSGPDKLFNEAVAELLQGRRLDEALTQERLRALAGVSREWSWPGVGLAIVHSLKDDIAADLYAKYPALAHGPFKPHLLPRWHVGFPKLLARVQRAGDEDFEDLLASRYLTFVRGDQNLATANALSDRYEALRLSAPEQFARRAANILTRAPAYSIWNHDALLKANRLARLLFVRSFDAYLAAPASVGDLVEGSDIHVMTLAYRILALNDDRARALAVGHLDLLLGALLRPLHRKTRLPALEALANAAKADAGAAARILPRARDAFRLPDKNYPKEELALLVARLLRSHPELRSAREQPVVHRREEKAA